MKYSMCLDIMFVGVGENGPVWPDTDGLLEAMDFAKKHNMDMIEFFGFEGRDLERIAKKSRELSLPINFIVAKGGVCAGDPERHAEFIEGVRQTIPAARQLGVRAIVMSPDADRKVSRDEVKQQMVRDLKEAAPLAKEAGIEIWLEPVTGGYFVDSKEAFDIIDMVGEENVKLLYDIFHFQNLEGNLCNTIRDNIDKIAHFHGAGAPARCELTVGELNYTYILQFIKDLGYEGTFGLEFFTFENREQKVKDSCSILI